MGAWGYRPFENDFANDWLVDFLEQPHKRILTRTLRAVTRLPASERELPEESAAVGAAEVVACLAGKGEAGPVVGLADWLVGTRTKVDKALLTLAIQAIDAVKAESELRDSFDAAGSRHWLAMIADLRRRLRAVLREQGKRRRRSHRLSL